MLLHAVKSYIASNIITGLKTSPIGAPLKAWIPVPCYAVLALALGVYADLFDYGFVESRLVVILPLTLFIFPSCIEEIFFRGLFIPNNAISHSIPKNILYVSLSTVLFVLWHPLNALTLNKSAASIFLNPYFLAITALLGITCSIAYIFSRSLWLPIAIHWLTVLVWVIFLGGRNKILEL